MKTRLLSLLVLRSFTCHPKSKTEHVSRMSMSVKLTVSIVKVKFNQFQFIIYSLTSMKVYIICIRLAIFCDCTLQDCDCTQSRITYCLSKFFILYTLMAHNFPMSQAIGLFPCFDFPIPAGYTYIEYRKTKAFPAITEIRLNNKTNNNFYFNTMVIKALPLMGLCI